MTILASTSTWLGQLQRRSGTVLPKGARSYRPFLAGTAGGPSGPDRAAGRDAVPLSPAARDARSRRRACPETDPSAMAPADGAKGDATMFMPRDVRHGGQARNAAPRPAGAHVAVRGLGHAYRRADGPVLSDISFEIAPGEVLALLGRSGCGKSTLLHMIAGLSRPGAGEVVINGNTVTAPSARWVMMFQAPSLYPWMTVAQNVALGLRFTRRAHEIATRVPEVLDLVELGAYSGRNVQDLSGGQQQRVALARSLATRPELLLLDEPFSALDAFTRRSLQGDVRQIARALGLTLVVVTHDVSEAVAMADRVLVLDAAPGRIARDTTIALDDADRAGATDAVRAEQSRLMQLYTDVAHGGAGGPDT